VACPVNGPGLSVVWCSETRVVARPEAPAGIVRGVDGLLVVVSCGEQKIWKRYPDAGPIVAQDAYTSSLFTKSRRYAERFADRWLVLSAKYGFIEPDFLIPGDYNVSFYDPEAISIEHLRAQVAAKHLAQCKTVGVLGSEMYWRHVVEACDGSPVVLRHINGNVSFPALFHRLINKLIADDTPFREEAQE
jgi:hypothetical protein